MKVIPSVATLALLAAIPLTATAADTSADSSGGAASIPTQFRQLDRDKDGMISRNEAKRSKDMAGRFDQMDTDRDGQLSVSEWQSGSAASGAAGVSGESRERGASDMGTSGSGSSGSGSMGTGSSGSGSTGSGSSY